MNKYKCANIVIGKPLIEPKEIFCSNDKEWEQIKNDIYYTNELFLPQIMLDLGIVKSKSEIYRNKPELAIRYDENSYDYNEIKWGKTRLFILKGKVKSNSYLNNYEIGDIVE